MNLGDIIIGVGSLLAGWRALSGASPSFGMKTDDLRRSLDHISDQRPPVKVTAHKNVHTIEQRIVHLRKLIHSGAADPHLRMMTARLVASKCGKQWCVPERNYGGEIKAVFKAVKEHVRYTRDTEGKDLYQHPLRTLQIGAADCDDLSTLLGAMLMSIGYPVVLRVVRSPGAKDWNHVYVAAGLPPEQPMHWIPLDASVPGKPAGWESQQVVARRDFKV